MRHNRFNSTTACSGARRGLVLVVMIVLLAVVMLLAANWAGRVVSERRQTQRQLLEVQAVRLAESGLERAEARLAADPTYAGETWEIAADEWEGQRPASVEIEIKEVEESGQVRLTARATYPARTDEAVRRTRSTVVSLSNE
jgi:Tfp pilus assembly protein PilX